ncbi:hypothetical protein M1403_03300 [Patescibacteria group bacterium]|nr:hypothetical protein [Patescibacteria group bacterium]
MTNAERKIRNAISVALVAGGSLTGCSLFQPPQTPDLSAQRQQEQQFANQLNQMQNQINTLTAPTGTPTSTPTPDWRGTIAALSTLSSQNEESKCQTVPLSATSRPRLMSTPAVPGAPLSGGPVSCEWVFNEAAPRQVVFEGFPSHAIQVLTTDTAQQKNFFKAAPWNLSADLNLGFAEPGGLSNPSKIKTVDSTPYLIPTELQGWTKLFLQEGTLTWVDNEVGITRKVALTEEQNRTFGVYIREKYDTNGNTPPTIELDCNVAKHGQVQHVDRPNSAFVSEGQLGQESMSVFTGKNFDGSDYTIPNDNTARGKFTVVIIDMNTGAYTVASQMGMGQPFILESQNWK